MKKNQDNLVFQVAWTEARTLSVERSDVNTGKSVLLVQGRLPPPPFTSSPLWRPLPLLGTTEVGELNWPAREEPRGPGRASSYSKNAAPFLPATFPPVSHSGVLRVGADTVPISNPRLLRDPRAERAVQTTRTPATPTHLPLPPTCRSTRGQLAAVAPFSSRPGFAWRPQYQQLPALPAAVTPKGPGRCPEPENRWPWRRARDSRLSLTQKMKLNPKSRYLMHLLPPLTGMMQAGLAFRPGTRTTGTERTQQPTKTCSASGWPEAPLLKSATPYGARPAAMRMCRGMPTPPPAHLPRPCLVPLPRPRFWDCGSTRSVQLSLHPTLPSRVPELLFLPIFVLPTVSRSL